MSAFEKHFNRAEWLMDEAVALRTQKAQNVQ